MIALTAPQLARVTHRVGLSRTDRAALAEETAQEVRSIGRELWGAWPRCPVTGQTFDPAEGRWVSTRGLAALAEAGRAWFDTAPDEWGHSGNPIPGNLILSDSTSRLMVGPAPFFYGRRFLSPEGADELLSAYGRIRGWLRTAATLPALSRVVRKTQSARGVNSPATTVYLPKLWERYPSPHRLERKLWQVRHRASQILAAWGSGYTPAWADIAQALLVDARVGKAALVTAAATLTTGYAGGRKFWTYREARDYLVSIRSAAFPVEDTSDGVISRREAEPTLERFGIAVYRIRLADEHGRYSLQWLVRSETGRTYHSDEVDPQRAYFHALGAWKWQNKAAAANPDLIGFLEGDQGYCPLIDLADSYAAGNCHIGTTRWAAARGWSVDRQIPGIWLIPHLDDERVRWVVVAARDRRLGHQLAA